MSYASLRQTTATYWAPGTPNGYGGQSYASPVALSVRWQDKRERMIDDNGKEFISNAVIYCDTELSKNGWLYLGSSVELEPVAGAYKIEIVERSQNPQGTIVVHKVTL